MSDLASTDWRGLVGMQIEGRLNQTVLNSWKLINQGFGAFISHLSDEDLQTLIAPGRNRVLYVLGHLTATNDRLFPLLGIGERGTPHRDAVYIDQTDRALDDPIAPSVLKTASDDVAQMLTEALERTSPEEWLESTQLYQTRILLEILAVIVSRSFSAAPTT